MVLPFLEGHLLKPDSGTAEISAMSRAGEDGFDWIVAKIHGIAYAGQEDNCGAFELYQFSRLAEGEAFIARQRKRENPA